MSRESYYIEERERESVKEREREIQFPTCFQTLGQTVTSMVMFSGHLLCILTSEQVLCMSFTGQNHLFNNFWHIFLSQMVKRKSLRKRWKISEKKASPVYRCYSLLDIYHAPSKIQAIRSDLSLIHALNNVMAWLKVAWLKCWLSAAHILGIWKGFGQSTEHGSYIGQSKYTYNIKALSWEGGWVNEWVGVCTWASFFYITAVHS